MKKAHPYLIRLVLLSFLGCSTNKPGGQEPTNDPPMADGGVVLDAGNAMGPECRMGTRWQPGTPVFREVTNEWGLENVEGIYFSVTDIDKDGWADVLVRNGGGGNDFAPMGSQARWVLRNTGNKTFVDLAQSSGLLRSRGASNEARSGNVFISGDIDNDGDLDVFTGQGRTDHTTTGATSEIMLNNGNGTYSLGPQDSDARFANVASHPGGASFVDFNLDGFLDLWVVHTEMPGLVPMQDRLLIGDGIGGFRDVTFDRNLATVPWQSLNALNEARAHSWGWGANACDLNGDGLPELLASSYGRAPNHLWQAQRSSDDRISFTNASIASGYAFDEDVDWTTNLSAQCFCRDNPMATDCAGVPVPENTTCDGLRNAFGPNYRWNHDYGREAFQMGGVTGTTICIDINNDGHLDLFNNEIVHGDVGSNSDPSQILINTGESSAPRFERPGVEITGLTRVDNSTFWDHGDMTGAIFDFDNDGWNDIYIGASDYPGNKGLLYHQSMPLRFTRLEVNDYFTHFRSHGVTVADFDRDGDLDIMVGHSRHRCEGPASSECNPTSQIRLFENTLGQDGNWIQFDLEGTADTNRGAIGARVYVSVGGTTQVQQIEGGHGRHGLQNDRILHYGLGPNCEVEVRVVWPDFPGSSQTFTLKANQRYAIKQYGQPMVVLK